MVVLSRRAQESILIGEDITATVLEVNGAHVRLGVHAPSDVDVHREEVFVRIKREQYLADFSLATVHFDRSSPVVLG